VQIRGGENDVHSWLCRRLERPKGFLDVHTTAPGQGRDAVVDEKRDTLSNLY
jgi:hypothetical protein